LGSGRTGAFLFLNTFCG
ncbi:hypothetical protein VCHC50A2_1554, partial [Vibrio cholerae HC-50A2]